MDNAAAEHYVNVRYGHVESLERLAETVEDAEREALCWALARYIRGANNVVSDAGSRDPGFARRWFEDPYRLAMLRRDLFTVLERDLGVSFTLDLFADRQGWTAMAPEWRSPERTGFEATLTGHAVWAHPPRAILGGFLKWLAEKLRAEPELRLAVLMPEDSRAPWCRPSLIGRLRRAQRWPSRSDLFRWAEADPAQPSQPRFRRGPRSDLPYCVLITAALACRS